MYREQILYQFPKYMSSSGLICSGSFSDEDIDCSNPPPFDAAPYVAPLARLRAAGDGR